MVRPVIVVAVLLSAEVLAADAPRLKVAVLGVRAESGISQGTANLLAELVSTDLMHSGRYDVLTPADVATLIGVERQRALLGCNQNDNCLVELGDALGTDLIVDASVGTVGQLRVLALRVYDTKKQRAVARESQTVNDETALVEATHSAIAHALGLAPAPGRPVPGGDLAPSVTSRGSFAGWFVLGGAAVLAAVGAVFGGLALADYGAFKLSPYDDALGNGAKTKAFVADGLYGAALVTGVVAVVVLLVTR